MMPAHPAARSHQPRGVLTSIGGVLTPRRSQNLAAAIIVALNGLYIVLVAFGNVTDFDTNRAFVIHVLTMDTTNFGAAPGTGLDPNVMWRAVPSRTLQIVAYIGVIIWEGATGIVLTIAFVYWIREHDTDYRLARGLSTLGLLMLLLLFLGGFIAIGGEWFQMWRSTAWNGIDPAFRNSALAAVGLVFINLPSTRLPEEPQARGRPSKMRMPVEAADRLAGAARRTNQSVK